MRPTAKLAHAAACSAAKPTLLGRRSLDQSGERQHSKTQGQCAEGADGCGHKQQPHNSAHPVVPLNCPFHPDGATGGLLARRASVLTGENRQWLSSEYGRKHERHTGDEH